MAMGRRGAGLERLGLAEGGGGAPLQFRRPTPMASPAQLKWSQNFHAPQPPAKKK